MHYIDRSQTQPPKSLISDRTRQIISDIEKYIGLPAEKRLQRRAPFEIEFLHEIDVRNAIVEFFHKKCAYCEQYCDRVIVEHFRPRRIISEHDLDSGVYYAWLSYAWENLYACCNRCNMAKANLFPVEGPRALDMRQSVKRVRLREL